MKLVTAQNGKKIVKMFKKEWQDIGKKAGWIKKAQLENPSPDSPYWKEVDKNTQIVGKIKTVADAKHILGIKNLPSPGYESIVDKGMVNLSYSPQNSYYKPMTYSPDANGIPRKYETYLQNNAGRFRVWTWISVG